MNRGLLQKCIREVWRSTLLFALGMFAFETLLAAILPSFYEDLAGQFLDHPFIRNVLRGLLGTGVGDHLGPMTIGAMVWVHPVVLTLLWAHEIMFCTRLPVAEIDRGTIDVLFSLPVSRWRAYGTETVVWLASGAVLATAALSGNLLGSRLASGSGTAPLGPMVMIVANLFCLYVAVGGLTYVVSACSDRRGRAVGLVFAIVLCSFLLDALGQFWEPAQSIAFLGVLHYYRPFEILQDGAMPWGNAATLCVVGGVLWAIGGTILARRDIATV